jgi:hypothetical protein
MGDFELPGDLSFNRGLIADPAGFAQQHEASSWLYLCGEEFAEVEGGMSFGQVEAAVPVAVNIPVDTIPLTMEIAQQQIAALDAMPRPTLVTCRSGPKSSALVYLYAGLHQGASSEDVLARAEADGAPFAQAEPLRAWVAQGLEELRDGR